METQRLLQFKNPLLVLSVLILVWAVFGLLDVRNQAYRGYTTDGNNTITQIDEGGPADVAGFETGDVIRSIGGIAVTDTRARGQRSRPGVGEVRTFEVERSGRTVSLELTYSALPTNNVLVNYGGIGIGLLFLVFGVWAFVAAPSGATLYLALLGVAFSVPFTVGPYFASPAVRTAVGVVIVLMIIVGLAILTHFLMVFPKKKRALERRYLFWVIYGPATVSGLLAAWLLVAQPAATSAVNTFFRVLFGLLVVGYFGASLIALLHSYAKAHSEERSASGLNLLMVGAVVGIAPTLAISLLGLVAPQVNVPGAQFLFLSFGLLPVMFAFAAVGGARATQMA